MSILEAILLGLVQGLTDFLPISSSGHLVIMREMLGIKSGGLAFDVALHIGTLLALFIYFWPEVIKLIGGLLGRNSYKRLSWLIAMATVPAVIAGTLLQEAAETTFRSVELVAVNLILVGILMIVAEYVSSRHTERGTQLESVKPLQAMAVGLVQMLALIPGVSRSGSTITAGLFFGLERVAATRFSFLLAIPITFGAILKVLLDGSNMAEFAAMPGVFIAGIVTALISGLLAIRFLLDYLAKHSLRLFAYYRFGLAIVVLLMAARL